MTDETPVPGPAPAESFGRVAEDGTVYLTVPGGDERVVGQYTAGTPEEALAFYVTKYQDLSSTLDLEATRLVENKCTPAQAHQVAARAREQLEHPTFVGDVPLLMAKIGQLEVLANIRRQMLDEEHKAAAQHARLRRVELVEEAEQLATSTAWKQTTERFSQLVEEWRILPKAPGDQRADTDALWERFRVARRTFDKGRRAHREEVQKQQRAAVEKKTAIVATSEELSTSTDWQATAQAFRDLMEQWKAAGFAGKKEDEALWQQFRSAQDVFFAARKASFSERDASQTHNLAAKNELLAKAEALLPVTNAKSARRAFRDIQSQWASIGHVPRTAMRKVDSRLRAVDDAIRAAEQSVWRRSNPEIRDRAQGLADAYRRSVAGLAADLEAAQAAGDESRATDIESSLKQQRLLLEAAEQSLSGL